MLCLALDFAGPTGRAAVAEPETVLSEGHRPAGPGTVEGIVPFLLGLIGEAGVAAGDIGRFVATTGPGSFTGIRAGLAAASGLAAAAGGQVNGITLFDSHAMALAEADTPLLIALDGRRAEVFLQLRIPGGGAPGAGAPSAGTPSAGAPGEPACLTPEAVAGWAPDGPMRLAGSAAERVRDALVAAGRPPADLRLAAEGGSLAIGALARQGAAGSVAGPAIPFYGREPDVSRPK